MGIYFWVASLFAQSVKARCERSSDPKLNHIDNIYATRWVYFYISYRTNTNTHNKNMDFFPLLFFFNFVNFVVHFIQ